MEDANYEFINSSWISCFHFAVTKLNNKSNLRDDRFVAGRFQSIVMGKARQSSVGASGRNSSYSSEPGSRKEEGGSRKHLTN